MVSSNFESLLFDHFNKKKLNFDNVSKKTFLLDAVQFLGRRDFCSYCVYLEFAVNF